MALLTGKDLELLTGIKQKQFYNYRSRLQLVWDEETKLYDANNPVNIAFIEKWSERKDLKQAEPEKKKRGRKPGQNKNTQTKVLIPTTKKHVEPEEKVRIPDQAPKEKTEYQKNIEEKTGIELKIKKAELESKELGLQKQRGELIDLQSTMNTIKEYTETFKKELLQNIQTHIQDICARHSIDSGKSGEYKLKVIDIINKSNKTSVEQLENKLK